MAHAQALRDDDELRLRGVIGESRKFNPLQKRDPDGTWGDGIPGPGGVLKDALKLAGRIELKDGERLAGSGRLNLDSPTGVDVVWAAIDGPDGREFRIGGIPDEDVGKWRAGDLGGTVSLSSESATRLVDDLLAAESDANERAIDAEDAWASGKAPTDPVLLGKSPVASGSLDAAVGSGEANWGFVDWSVYLDGSEPVSWTADVRVGEDVDSVKLDADGLTKLINGLDGVVSAPVSARSDAKTSDARMFSEELHPRVPAGQAGGGQFGSKGTQKQPAKKAAVNPDLLKRIEAMKPAPKRAVTTKRRSAAMELCTRAFDFEFDSDVRDGRTLEGYAAVFNTPARIRDLQGDFDETIAPGAFKRSLAQRTPVLQFDHGKDPRIGGTPIGKIDALSEDSRGLHVRARLFTHPDVERVREAIAEGAVSGMSFRFGVPDKGDVWGRNADGVDTREIRDADIHELGPVVFPAYDQTSVSVRSLLSQLGPEETRELLHELAGHLGLAVDLQDLTGQPSARSAGGGDIGTSPGVGRVPATPSTRQLLDDGTLRLKGIIK